MMKRLRWTFLGAALGVAGYTWARRRARQAVPGAGDVVEGARAGARSAQEAVRGLSVRLRDALAEGREAMRERELELRAELLPD